MANKIRFTETRSFLRAEYENYSLLSKHIGKITPETSPVKKILTSTKFVYLCSLFEAFTHQAMEEYYSHLQQNPKITKDKIKFGKILQLLHDLNLHQEIINELYSKQCSLEVFNILGYVSKLVQKNLHTGKSLQDLYEGKLFEKYTLIKKYKKYKIFHNPYPSTLQDNRNDLLHGKSTFDEMSNTLNDSDTLKQYEKYFLEFMIRTLLRLEAELNGRVI
jgi:hypothetical protein